MTTANNVFTIKRGDTLPALARTLGDASGAVDLTGASVRFIMRAANRDVVVVDFPAQIVSAVEGKVSYAWRPEDTAVAGSYDAEFEVTFGDGNILTFPNGGNIRISIVPDLRVESGDVLQQVTMNWGSVADGEVLVRNGLTLDGIPQGVTSDAQHGERGGADLHAVATELQNGFLSAVDKRKYDAFGSGWDVDLCAYFLVDNELGDDTRDGVVFAAPGSVIDPTNKAIKTIGRLFQLWSRLGSGRTCAILLKGRSSGTYQTAAAANDVFQARGVAGYYRLVIRGSTDLTNSAADQLTCGGRPATGFHAAGYNVTPSVLTITGVTNTTPVQIQTNVAHGRSTGDQVQLASIGGQPSANGEYTITVTGSNTFTLNNTRAIVSEAYTSGGTATFYVCTRVGGGAAAFPVQNSSTGFRLRFDAATANVALRNTCYEIFSVGGDTVIPGRFFTAAPTAADVVYVEEPGVQFTDVQYQGFGATTITGIGSTGTFVVQGSEGAPTAASGTSGAVYLSFCHAVGVLSLAGPFGQAFITNLYVNENNVTVTNGGNRASAYSVGRLNFASIFRSMAFGTTAPNSFSNVQGFSAFHSCFSNRGFDFNNCGVGIAAVASGSFSNGRIGKVASSFNRRNRLGGSAHNGSINLYNSALSLFGIFFDGSTANCVSVYGLGSCVTIDDCIGSATVDVPGLDLSTAARGCDISIGLVAPCSMGGSAGKEVQLYNALQVPYADLLTGHASDSRGNRVAGTGGITQTKTVQGTWFDVPSVTADPAGNPATGMVRVFFRSDTAQLCEKDSAGAIKRSPAFT
jgi:hypothetical protein